MRSLASVLVASALVALAACDSTTDPRFVPAKDCGAPGLLVVDTLARGASPSTVRSTSTVVLDYVGTLVATRDTFDARRTTLPLGGTVPGFRNGLAGTVVGDSVRLTIPPNLGYGGRDRTDPGTGEVSIPACSTLQFNVRVIDIVG